MTDTTPLLIRILSDLVCQEPRPLERPWDTVRRWLREAPAGQELVAYFREEADLLESAAELLEAGEEEDRLAVAAELEKAAERLARLAQVN